MTYKIRPKRSNVPSKVPTAADLDLGELAINMADQKIYTKTPGNTIVELGGAASAIDLLAVDSDIIPDGDLTRSLGSPSHQWADLYVGNATIYLNNVPLGLDGDQNLTFNGNVVANSDGAVVVDWTNITNAPGGIDSGNITFSGNEINSINDIVNIVGSNYAQLESNSSYIWVQNNGAYISVNSESSWLFDADGVITFPLTVASPVGQTTQAFGMGNLFACQDGDNWVIATGNPSTGAFGENGISISPGIESYGYLSIPSDSQANTSPVGLGNLDSNGKIRLAANTHEWIFDQDGNLTLPVGGDIKNASGASVLGGSGNPFNQTLNNNDSVQFANVQVNGTGKLTQGWNTVTRASGYETVPAGQTVDIWTADNAEVTGAKFTVVFENRTAEPYYNNFDTLTCEIVLAKKRTGGSWADPVISVYGIVHTSDLPTVTFSAVTDIDGRAVLRCTPVGSITSVCYVKVHSVEQQSPSIQNDWC